jgi:hypothetical protein
MSAVSGKRYKFNKRNEEDRVRSQITGDLVTSGYLGWKHPKSARGGSDTHENASLADESTHGGKFDLNVPSALIPRTLCIEH